MSPKRNPLFVPLVVLYGPLPSVVPKQAQTTVGTTTAELKELAHWLLAQEVIQVYMDSTSQYWCPIWNFLECFDF
ncbi:hypothetical protein [Lactococcus lactis]|uniref:Transposase n=1 Tax=Lactococcus lactis subsp. lactis TaxID=1360 RepID=A0A1V0NEZ7_LACLL|nr:hypothetical protein [Lactococcus lactis]ARD98496.1 transposase [Lactococcus lactis subsp. lactis]NLS47337.1 hypothetical protein [Lactococcus lactis]